MHCDVLFSTSETKVALLEFSVCVHRHKSPTCVASKDEGGGEGWLSEKSQQLLLSATSHICDLRVFYLLQSAEHFLQLGEETSFLLLPLLWLLLWFTLFSF